MMYCSSSSIGRPLSVFFLYGLHDTPFRCFSHMRPLDALYQDVLAIIYYL